MDEQRILEEMERMLAADDPRLAARRAAFGQPGAGHALRTRRARAVLSLLTLTIIGCVAAVIYMVSVFHTTGAQLPTHSLRSSQASSQPVTSLSADNEVRAVPTPYCVVLLTPTHCTGWKSSGDSGGKQPSPFADEPARASSH